MNNGVGCERFNYDPWYHGLGYILGTEIDPVEVKRRYQKRYLKKTEKTQKEIDTLTERAYKIAKYIYYYGEVDTRNIKSALKISNAGKVVTGMTHMSFLIEDDRWVVYESDSGYIIGLINAKGEVPEYRYKKTAHLYKAPWHKYIVCRGDEHYYFKSQEKVGRFLNIDQQSVRNIIKGKSVKGAEGVKIECLRKNQHDSAR